MASGEGMPGLAEKLNHLFATVPAPTRSGVYSNDTAARALEERGVTVSGVHISHLRSGRRDNPSARLLAALGGPVRCADRLLLRHDHGRPHQR